VGGPESNTAARPAHNPMLGSARSGGGLGLHVGGEQLSYAEQLTAQWERVRTDPRVRILQILPSMLLETVAAKLDIRAAARLAQTCSAANRAVQTMAENRVTALNVSKQWLITARFTPLHFLHTGYLPLQRSIRSLEAAQFSSNGTLATATAGDHTRMWNLETGLCERTFQHGRRLRHGLIANVWIVQFSPDGRWLLICSDDATMQLFSVASAECMWLSELEHDKTVIGVVQFSRDSSQLVSAADDMTMRVWSVDSGECLRLFDLWADYGEVTHGYGQVTTVQFSPDGRELVFACEDTMAMVWTITTAQHRLLLEGHENTVTSVDFSSGACSIVTGSLDQTVRVWNAETGHCVHTLHGQHTNKFDDFTSLVHCHPDNQTIVWTSNDSSHELQVVSVVTGQCLHRLLGHRGRITLLRFTSHGQHIVSASSDNIRQWTSVPSVRQWSAVTGECMQMFTGHITNPANNPITFYYHVDFSPDGKHILVLTEAGSGSEHIDTHVGWLASGTTAGLRSCDAILGGRAGTRRVLPSGRLSKNSNSLADASTPALASLVGAAAEPGQSVAPSATAAAPRRSKRTQGAIQREYIHRPKDKKTPAERLICCGKCECCSDDWYWTADGGHTFAPACCREPGLLISDACPHTGGRAADGVPAGPPIVVDNRPASQQNPGSEADGATWIQGSTQPRRHAASSQQVGTPDLMPARQASMPTSTDSAQLSTAQPLRPRPPAPVTSAPTASDTAAATSPVSTGDSLRASGVTVTLPTCDNCILCSHQLQRMDRGQQQFCTRHDCALRLSRLPQAVSLPTALDVHKHWNASSRDPKLICTVFWALSRQQLRIPDRFVHTIGGGWQQKRDLRLSGCEHQFLTADTVRVRFRSLGESKLRVCMAARLHRVLHGLIFTAAALLQQLADQRHGRGAWASAEASASIQWFKAVLAEPGCPGDGVLWAHLQECFTLQAGDTGTHRCWTLRPDVHPVQFQLDTLQLDVVNTVLARLHDTPTAVTPLLQSDWQLPAASARTIPLQHSWHADGEPVRIPAKQLEETLHDSSVWHGETGATAFVTQLQHPDMAGPAAPPFLLRTECYTSAAASQVRGDTAQLVLGASIPLPHQQGLKVQFQLQGTVRSGHNHAVFQTMLVRLSSGGMIPMYTEAWDVTGDPNHDCDWFRVGTPGDSYPRDGRVSIFTGFIWCEEGAVDSANMPRGFDDGTCRWGEAHGKWGDRAPPRGAVVTARRVHMQWVGGRLHAREFRFIFVAGESEGAWEAFVRSEHADGTRISPVPAEPIVHNICRHDGCAIGGCNSLRLPVTGRSAAFTAGNARSTEPAALTGHSFAPPTIERIRRSVHKRHKSAANTTQASLLGFDLLDMPWDELLRRARQHGLDAAVVTQYKHGGDTGRRELIHAICSQLVGTPRPRMLATVNEPRTATAQSAGATFDDTGARRTTQHEQPSPADEYENMRMSELKKCLQRRGMYHAYMQGIADSSIQPPFLLATARQWLRSVSAPPMEPTFSASTQQRNVSRHHSTAAAQPVCRLLDDGDDAEASSDSHWSIQPTLGGSAAANANDAFSVPGRPTGTYVHTFLDVDSREVCQWRIGIPEDENLIDFAGGWNAAAEHAGDGAFWSAVESNRNIPFSVLAGKAAKPAAEQCQTSCTMADQVLGVGNDDTRHSDSAATLSGQPQILGGVPKPASPAAQQSQHVTSRTVQADVLGTGTLVGTGRGDEDNEPRFSSVYRSIVHQLTRDPAALQVNCAATSDQVKFELEAFLKYFRESQCADEVQSLCYKNVRSSDNAMIPSILIKYLGTPVRIDDTLHWLLAPLSRTIRLKTFPLSAVEALKVICMTLANPGDPLKFVCGSCELRHSKPVLLTTKLRYASSPDLELSLEETSMDAQCRTVAALASAMSTVDSHVFESMPSVLYFTDGRYLTDLEQCSQWTCRDPVAGRDNTVYVATKVAWSLDNGRSIQTDNLEFQASAPRLLQHLSRFSPGILLRVFIRDCLAFTLQRQSAGPNERQPLIISFQQHDPHDHVMNLDDTRDLLLAAWFLGYDVTMNVHPFSSGLMKEGFMQAARPEPNGTLSTVQGECHICKQIVSPAHPAISQVCSTCRDKNRLICVQCAHNCIVRQNMVDIEIPDGYQYANQVIPCGCVENLAEQTPEDLELNRSELKLWATNFFALDMIHRHHVATSLDVLSVLIVIDILRSVAYSVEGWRSQNPLRSDTQEYRQQFRVFQLSQLLEPLCDTLIAVLHTKLYRHGTEGIDECCETEHFADPGDSIRIVWMVESLHTLRERWKAAEMHKLLAAVTIEDEGSLAFQQWETLNPTLGHPECDLAPSCTVPSWRTKTLVIDEFEPGVLLQAQKRISAIMALRGLALREAIHDCLCDANFTPHPEHPRALPPELCPHNSSGRPVAPARSIFSLLHVLAALYKATRQWDHQCALHEKCHIASYQKSMRDSLWRIEHALEQQYRSTPSRLDGLTHLQRSGIVFDQEVKHVSLTLQTRECESLSSVLNMVSNGVCSRMLAFRDDELSMKKLRLADAGKSLQLAATFLHQHAYELRLSMHLDTTCLVLALQNFLCPADECHYRFTAPPPHAWAWKASREDSSTIPALTTSGFSCDRKRFEFQYSDPLDLVPPRSFVPASGRERETGLGLSRSRAHTLWLQLQKIVNAAEPASSARNHLCQSPPTEQMLDMLQQDPAIVALIVERIDRLSTDVDYMSIIFLGDADRWDKTGGAVAGDRKSLIADPRIAGGRLYMANNLQVVRYLQSWTPEHVLTLAIASFQALSTGESLVSCPIVLENNRQENPANLPAYGGGFACWRAQWKQRLTAEHARQMWLKKPPFLVIHTTMASSSRQRRLPLDKMGVALTKEVQQYQAFQAPAHKPCYFRKDRPLSSLRHIWNTNPTIDQEVFEEADLFNARSTYRDAYEQAFYDDEHGSDVMCGYPIAWNTGDCTLDCARLQRWIPVKDLLSPDESQTSLIAHELAAQYVCPQPNALLRDACEIVLDSGDPLWAPFPVHSDSDSANRVTHDMYSATAALPWLLYEICRRPLQNPLHLAAIVPRHFLCDESFRMEVAAGCRNTPSAGFPLIRNGKRHEFERVGVQTPFDMESNFLLENHSGLLDVMGEWCDDEHMVWCDNIEMLGNAMLPTLEACFVAAMQHSHFENPAERHGTAHPKWPDFGLMRLFKWITDISFNTPQELSALPDVLSLVQEPDSSVDTQTRRVFIAQEAAHANPCSDAGPLYVMDGDDIWDGDFWAREPELFLAVTPHNTLFVAPPAANGPYAKESGGPGYVPPFPVTLSKGSLLMLPNNTPRAFAGSPGVFVQHADRQRSQHCLNLHRRVSTCAAQRLVTQPALPVTEVRLKMLQPGGCCRTVFQQLASLNARRDRLVARHYNHVIDDTKVHVQITEHTLQTRENEYAGASADEVRVQLAWRSQGFCERCDGDDTVFDGSTIQTGDSLLRHTRDSASDEESDKKSVEEFTTSFGSALQFVILHGGLMGSTGDRPVPKAPHNTCECCRFIVGTEYNQLHQDEGALFMLSLTCREARTQVFRFVERKPAHTWRSCSCCAAAPDPFRGFQMPQETMRFHLRYSDILKTRKLLEWAMQLPLQSRPQWLKTGSLIPVRLPHTYGSVHDHFRRFDERFQSPKNQRVSCIVAAYGTLDTFHFARDQSMGVYPETVTAAAAAGNTEILRACLQIETCPTFRHFYDNTVVAAARHGNVDTLELLLRHGGSPKVSGKRLFNDDGVSDAAVCSGISMAFDTHSDRDISMETKVMQVLREEFPLSCEILLEETPRIPTHLHTIPTFGPNHQNGHCDYTYSRCCAAAAEGGHINVFRRLVEHCVYLWDTPVISAAAARNGHLSFLKYAVEEKHVRCNFWVACAAARGGHVEVLQWLLRKSRLIFEHHTPLAAAIGGHLSVLQWAMSENVQWWPRKTVILARLNDHNSLVQCILDFLKAKATVRKITDAMLTQKIQEYLLDPEAMTLSRNDIRVKLHWDFGQDVNKRKIKEITTAMLS
jgi:WD40 repeat protein